MRLQQYINEIFKSKIDYELIIEESDRLVYKFKLNNVVYGVSIYIEDGFDHMVSNEDLEKIEDYFDIKNIKRENVWEVNFFDEEYGMTHEITGKQGMSAIKIFSVVMDITKDAIKKKNIKYLLFTADNNEISRVKLYEKFVKRYFKSYMKVQTIGDFSGRTTFIMKV